MFSMKLYNNTLEKTSINFMFNKIEMRGTKRYEIKRRGVYFKGIVQHAWVQLQHL